MEAEDVTVRREGKAVGAAISVATDGSTANVASEAVLPSPTSPEARRFSAAGFRAAGRAAAAQAEANGALVLESVNASKALEEDQIQSGLGCTQKIKVKDVAQEAKKFCNVAFANGATPPRKLQGLYWMNGSKSSAILACFSRGTWTPSMNKFVLDLPTTFLTKDGPQASIVFFGWKLNGLQYDIHFDDGNCNKGMIHPTSNNLLGKVGATVFDALMDHPIEDISGGSGDKFGRPTYLNLVTFHVQIDYYEAVRVMDGSGEPTQHLEHLLEALGGETTVVWRGACARGPSASPVR